MPTIRLAFVCLLSLFLVAPVLAQEETKKEPSLQDAKTVSDVFDYLNHENSKLIDKKDVEAKQLAVLIADNYMAASDKLLEIAKDNNDRKHAYNMRFTAFRYQIDWKIEGAQQRMEAFLDELAAKEETRYTAEGLRFQLFIDEARQTINTPEGVNAFKSGLKTWIYRNIDSTDMVIRADRIGGWVGSVAGSRENSAEQFFTELIEELITFIQSAECTLSAKEKATAVEQFNKRLERLQFLQFYRKALETVNSPDSFDTFKAELKAWINRKTVNVDEIPQIWLQFAEKCGIPAEQIINELIAYFQSPECTVSWEEHYATEWKKLLLTAFGSNLKLYGRTLDDKDFDWKSLRGKYVLVQFTATWCGPCHMEIPGMREVYKKYHDKGFEIVSIYIFERGDDPVASIREHVAHEKLPWIIISETLTEKAGMFPEQRGWQKGYGEVYGINGVPKMLLVNKTGKIIMTEARGEALQTKLAEIFE